MNAHPRQRRPDQEAAFAGGAGLEGAAQQLDAEEEPPQEIDFSDEHAPNASRSAAYRSYLYGAHPERWNKVVDDEYRSRDRSEFSEGEGESQDLRRQGWSHILEPHFRSG